MLSDGSKVVGSMLNPSPGFKTLTTTKPIKRASVETISKYKRVLKPTLPSFFMSPIEAMPCTTVQKIIGAIIIFTSLTKASPSGLRDLPISGKNAPMPMPNATPINTCM